MLSKGCEVESSLGVCLVCDGVLVTDSARCVLILRCKSIKAWLLQGCSVFHTLRWSSVTRIGRQKRGQLGQPGQQRTTQEACSNRGGVEKTFLPTLLGKTFAGVAEPAQNVLSFYDNNSCFQTIATYITAMLSLDDTLRPWVLPTLEFS
ncbi:hypothetical protein ACLKA6_010879 [Drosophila palustris]